MNKTRSLEQKEAMLGWWLVLPSTIIILSLILYPIITNIISSFFKVSLMDRDIFVGLENYRDIVSDPEFWKAVLVTLIYVVGTTLGTTLVGLGVAIVMNKTFPMRGLVRSLILLPYVAPVFSVVYAWKFIFDPVNGIFMDVMVERLGIFEQRFNLIGNPETALWVAIVFSIWKNFPFTYLMILARLQAIDKSMYEAADVDGAGRWQQFRFITMPELYFVLGSIVLLRVIWNFNKFEDVFLLTDNLKVLSIYTYFKAFVGVVDLGQGSALVILQFALLIGFILFYVKKVLKW